MVKIFLEKRKKTRELNYKSNNLKKAIIGKDFIKNNVKYVFTRNSFIVVGIVIQIKYYKQLLFPIMSSNISSYQMMNKIPF